MSKTVSKKKRRRKNRNRRFNAERQLQALTLDMLEGWRTREWGSASARNFADFCRWLAKQIARLAPKPK